MRKTLLSNIALMFAGSGPIMSAPVAKRKVIDRSGRYCGSIPGEMSGFAPNRKKRKPDSIRLRKNHKG